MKNSFSINEYISRINFPIDFYFVSSIFRCTPSSVLSPDNRRWLDSQGKKSPEINRRLILGQKSFTFTNDGGLIESSNPECEKLVFHLPSVIL